MTSLDFLRLTKQLSLDSYEGDDNTEDILDYLWSLKETIFEGSPALESSGKSEDRANTLRMKGNDYYKRRNYEKALELYNLSIVAAPHPVLSDDTSFLKGTSNEDDKYMFPRIDPARYGGIAKGESKCLAKGFANRSAIMFELNLYGKCLQDIELAVEYGYPKELLTKLEERKLRCINLQQAVLSDEEKTTVPKEPNAGSDTHVSDEQSCINSSSPSSSMAPVQLREKKKNLSLKDSLTAKPRKSPQLVEWNPDIPSLSNAVKVSYTLLKGRGIVAVRDIHPGEVLGVERAYAISIRKEKRAAYCSTCLCPCLTPLPCPGCSQVIFCSKTCRTRGLAEDHWLECIILSSVISSRMYSQLAPYKLLKTFSCQQLKAMIKDLQDKKTCHPKHRGFSSKGIYLSTSYQSVYHLSQESRDHPFQELLADCIYCILITKSLELSGRYFVNIQGEPVIPTKEDFLDTCKLLISNGMKIDGSSFSSDEKEDAFWGVFPSLSLLNHSCNPSAVIQPSGREYFLFALKPIVAGEEVMVSYTHPFELQRKETRIEMLNNFNFVCKCVACEGNWPTFSDLPVMHFKCLCCSVPVLEGALVCPQCTVFEQEGKLTSNLTWRYFQENRIQVALVEAAQMEEKIREKKPISKDDFYRICEATEVIHSHAVLPCQLIYGMQEFMVYYFNQCMEKID